MMRDLGDMAPIRSVLEQMRSREDAATQLRDDRVAAVLGDACRMLAEAIADAVRPPEGGVTPAEYAARHGLTRWAVYKRIQRGEIEVVRRQNRQIILRAA